MASAGFGNPQCGHTSARSETGWWHSGHFRRAIDAGSLPTVRISSRVAQPRRSSAVTAPPFWRWHGPGGVWSPFWATSQHQYQVLTKRLAVIARLQPPVSTARGCLTRGGGGDLLSQRGAASAPRPPAAPSTGAPGMSFLACPLGLPRRRAATLPRVFTATSAIVSARVSTPI